MIPTVLVTSIARKSSATSPMRSTVYIYIFMYICLSNSNRFKRINISASITEIFSWQDFLGVCPGCLEGYALNSIEQYKSQSLLVAAAGDKHI